MPDYDTHWGSMDVLLTDEIQFRIGDKKYLTLYILRLKNSKHVFFQNKKANKEKKVIGKNFQEKNRIGN